MRRLWIAVALLALMLGGALTNAWYSQRLTDRMGEQLRQAQAMTEEERWAEAVSLTRQVYDSWQAQHFYLHVTMRHSDTDQILRSFRAVLEYLELEEPDQYNAANADLITQLELLAEMEQVSLSNVL